MKIGKPIGFGLLVIAIALGLYFVRQRSLAGQKPTLLTAAVSRGTSRKQFWQQAR